MTEDEVKSLIRDYIVEHLTVDIDTSNYYYEGAKVQVSIYLGDELISDASATLPEPKVSY